MLEKYKHVAEWILVSTIAFCCAALGALVVVNIADVKDGAGWAQAFAAVGAIIAAFMVGQSQATAAIESAREANRLSEANRKRATLALVEMSDAAANMVAEIFQDNKFCLLVLKQRYSRPVFTYLHSALAAIPVHDLGDFDVIDAFLQIRTAIEYLIKHIDGAFDRIDNVRTENEGAVPLWIEFETGAISLNCSTIKRHSDRLRQSLK